MAVKESNLVKVPDIALNDKLRLVQQDSSRQISYETLVNDLDARIGVDSIPNPELKYRTIVSNDMLNLEHDEVVFINCLTGDVTLTLPSAVDAIDTAGESPVYVVKKISDATYNGHIQTTGGELIDGVETINLIGDKFPFVKFISDGSAWWSVS